MKTANTIFRSAGLTAVLALATAHLASAATYNANSCSASDVSSAIGKAANGDTVVIPNGSCTWTSGISTTKQIALQGATAGGVTITHSAGSATLLTLTAGSSARTRIANLRFMPGNGTGVYVEVNGSGQTPLMHDVYFNVPNFQLLHAVHWNATGGVIYRATFESTDAGGSDSGCLQVKSDVPWLAASTLGKLDVNGTTNLYIEDSSFINVGQCPDVDERARVVVRRSKFVGASGTTHGTTSYEGGRQIELYDNVFSYPDINRNLNRYFWVRAGAAVITRNSVQQITGQMWGTKNSFTFAVENAQRSGAANGCCTSYMCWRQPGSGGNGSAQVSDPVYLWGNTGTGGTSIGLNEGEPASCGTTYSTSSFFKLNRDYFVESGAKPGYESYTYPHPLTTSTGTTPTPAPTPSALPAPTQLLVN